MPAALPRRDLLRLAGLAGTAAVLAACTSEDGGGGGTTSPGAPDDPDLALRREVAAAEAALTALYAETAPGLPAALRAPVTALGARHTAYRDAVLGAAESGSPSSSASAPPSASPTGAGGSPAAQLARLRAAETKAAAARAAQSVRAQDRELARTLVLAGTGAAGAAEVLRGLA